MNTVSSLDLTPRKNHPMNKIIIAVIAVFTMFGCNAVSRKFGGDMTEKLDCGKKVVNVTWKESDFWILTRPMKADETPETYEFTEDANFGILEGTVTIIECKK